MSMWNVGLTQSRRRLRSMHIYLQICGIWMKQDLALVEQIMKVLVYLVAIQKDKVIGGKQEWVTDIECINAAGEALAPLLIFKGTNVNTRWINEQSPQGWYFATSKNGWTSNDLDLEWLKRVFEPLTRERAAGRQRLLIADGHGSHIELILLHIAWKIRSIF